MDQRSGVDPQDTFFAPATRASREQLDRSIQKVAKSPLISEILEAVGGVLLVLNPERQIVALNEGAMRTFQLSPEDISSAFGLRTGEAFDCVQVHDAPSGCGTGKRCSSCGTTRAILRAFREQQPVEYECELQVERDGVGQTREYWVRVAPITLFDSPYVIQTMHDIADKKRRETLERTFFHDIMNTLGALCAYRGLAEAEVISEPETLHEMGSLIDRVVDEVTSHQALLGAESERISVNSESCSTEEILDQLRIAFERNSSTYHRHVRYESCCDQLETDRTLLLRVLTNMLKNALEATPEGATVTVRGLRHESHITFTVHNPGKIPDPIASRIFTRSFSTKGEPGRGIGTYSMKLFGERYLRGKVGFVTDEISGTEFSIRLPVGLGTSSDSVARLRVLR